jgi:hypothetical protein
MWLHLDEIEEQSELFEHFRFVADPVRTFYGLTNSCFTGSRTLLGQKSRLLPMPVVFWSMISQ